MLPASAEAADDAPPVIKHTPVLKAEPGSAVDITAQITDPGGVALPRLYFRPAGRAEYSSVSMVAGDKGRYVGTLPAMVVTDTGVEYYLEAFDAQGNGPTHHGTPQAPHRITVVKRTAAPPPPKTTPWYKTWWFWTAVGAVVVGGAVTGAVLGTRGDDGNGNGNGDGHTLRVDAPAPQPTLGSQP